MGDTTGPIALAGPTDAPVTSLVVRSFNSYDIETPVPHSEKQRTERNSFGPYRGLSIYQVAVRLTL